MLSPFSNLRVRNSTPKSLLILFLWPSIFTQQLITTRPSRSYQVRDVWYNAPWPRVKAVQKLCNTHCNYLKLLTTTITINSGHRWFVCHLASEPIGLLYLQQLSVVQGKKVVVSSTVSITTLISAMSFPRLIAVFDGAWLAPFVWCCRGVAVCLTSDYIEYSAQDCAARPLKLSIHSGGNEHACRRRWALR